MEEPSIVCTRNLERCARSRGGFFKNRDPWSATASVQRFAPGRVLFQRDGALNEGDRLLAPGQIFQCQEVACRGTK